MVYHEIRKVSGKKQNYLIHNQRFQDKWIKKSKFIGYGDIHSKKLLILKEKFEEDLITDKKYKLLNKGQVEKIENLKKNYLKAIESLKKDEFEKFEESFFTELTYDSNAIEGNTLSLDETALILQDKIVPEGKTLREINEAKNHLEALKYLKEYNGDLNEALILKLHSIILKDIANRFNGRYRATNVRIFGSNVKLPDSQKVPQLIRNLIYWYKQNKNKYHQFELAVLVSMKFVTIHPFVDGNGRVSRLLMNFLLSKKDYPWINIYKKRRQRYMKAVRLANDEDYTLIFPLLIEMLEENLEGFGMRGN